MTTYADALTAIRQALADGPLRRADLEARLWNVGQEAALEYLVEAARAGFIGALDLDDAAGKHIDTFFFAPEDALWVLYGSPPS